MFNEWYARDISKKRRISNKIKGNAGEPMDNLPTDISRTPKIRNVGSWTMKRPRWSDAFTA